MPQEQPTTESAPRIQNYRDFADEYDRYRYQSDVDRMTERFRRRAFESLLPSRAERALDVACGTGRGVLILRERSSLVVGLDGTLEMLGRARAKTDGQRTHYCNANAAHLPFREGTFDLVSCLNFLHLFPERSAKLRFVREIARVLKPGGIAVVEFDNALHGLFLGPFRKYFGHDIGYDWPWIMYSCFPAEIFGSVRTAGANIPYIWRLSGLRRLESAALSFPLKYVANRLFVRAVRR